MSRKFTDLSEAEILALAIALEEEDSRVYGEFADGLREHYPSSATMFDEMQKEEVSHHSRLLDIYRERFGSHIPLIRRQDVKGFVDRRPVWRVRPLGLDAVRKQAEIMELETRRFYERAMERIGDVSVRQLLGDLAASERQHYAIATSLGEKIVTPQAREAEGAANRQLFLLQVVQPGLAGLMDGSVSTLAPIFAAAVATHNTHDAFLVGLAASVGAGISMGFAEALSDDGALTGRGRPLIRGAASGVMTATGGLGHTLPFLIQSYRLAILVATIVVAVELGVISYIRHRYMDTPIVSATVQVVFGGALVFLTGLLIGSS
jgi:rubrerythrin